MKSLDYSYPLEVIADTYLSRVGGFSPELEKREIGINMEALRQNTSLISGVSKARLKLFDSSKPVFLRKIYKIVGLEEYMDGFEYSKNGEVVLSEKFDEFRDVEGKEIIINAVEDFRIGDNFSKVVETMRERIRNINL